MVKQLENENLYCDCLDWNMSTKEAHLKGSTVYNYKLHTTGVTLTEDNAWHITAVDHEPADSELVKELEKIVN